MTKRWFGLGGLLCLVVLAGVFSGGGEAASAIEGLPAGWDTQSPSQLADTIDSLLGGELSGEARSALSAHLVQLLSGDQALSADGRSILRLLGQFTEHFSDLATDAQRSEVRAQLAARLTSDSALASTGTFDDLSQNVWDTAHAAGVDRAAVSSGAKTWMAANDWRSLSPERLAKLALSLDDELVSRMDYSVRWTGTLRPTGSGTYKLLADLRGGEAKIILGGNAIVDTEGGGAESAEVTLSGGQSYPLTFEYKYSADLALARDPSPEWIRSLFYGWSQAILRWKTGEGEWEVVPQAVFFTAGGAAGLDCAVFSGAALGGEAKQTRVDSEIALVIQGEGPGTEHHLAERKLSQVGIVLDGASPASTEHAAQREIASHLAAKLLSQDTGAPASETFWAAWTLVEHLSMGEKAQLLSKIAGDSASLSSVPVNELYHFQKAHRHMGDALVDGVILAWAEGRPSVPTVMGPFPMWDTEAGYMHQNFGGYWHTGAQLAGDSQVERLRSALEEADGSCNESLAKFLTFAELERGKSAEWCQYLGGKLAVETLTGDARASWLFARAVAEEFRRGDKARIWASRNFLDEALTSATSESVKLRAVGEIAARMAAGAKGDEARSFLSSVESQLQGPVAAGKFTAWRGEIAAIETDYASRRVKAEDASKASHVKELERRLQKAQSLGRDRSVARYQRLLSAAREN